MLKQLRRTLWQRGTAFWDQLFQLAEQHLTSSLHDLAKAFRRRSDRQSFSKEPLTVEILEPRWLLSLTAGTGSMSILHGNTIAGTSVIDDYCTDTNSLPISLVSHTEPTHGSLTMASDGTYSYAAPLAFVGTDAFTFTVTNGSNDATGTVDITVTDNAPVITGVMGVWTLHDHAVSETGVVGSVTEDPDGDSLSVVSHTTPPHGAVVIVSSDGGFIYTPAAGYVGADGFDYTVSDGAETAVGTVSLTVTDQAPVAVDDSYQIAENHTLTVNAPWRGVLANDYDPDSADSLTVVAYAQPAHGSVTVASDGTFTYTAATNYVGADSFPYTVSDGAETATATVALTVASAPTFTWTPTVPTNPSVTALAAQTNVEGDVVALGSLNVTASDPHGYALQYAALNLPPGLSIDSGLGYISGTVAAQDATYNGGVYDVTLLVTNADGGSATAGFPWTITAAPPTVTNPGDQTNYSGDSVSVPLTASQLDGDPLSFAAVGLPADLSIDPDSGVISGNLTLSDVSPTPYSVTVTATDDTPSTPLSASQTFAWTVAPGTPSPSLTNPGNQVNAVGDDVDVLLNATDLGGYPLTVTASGLPSGLSIDPSSGEITGTLPNSAASGTPYAVTVTASDGQVSTSDTFTMAVGGVSLTNPGDQISLDSDTVSLTLGATDAALATLTYSETGLPSGLSINSSTGVISGTVGATGDATVTVAASDGTASDSQTFTWEVDRFALDTPANQSNREGTSVSVTLTASDAVGTPTFSASGLPGGLSLNATTGVISGTLADNAHLGGPYGVTVTAADGSASISQSFVWSVTPQLALVSPGSQGDAAGDSVSVALTATDFSAGTLTYSASGLPSGLSINATTGVISGTVGTGSGTPYRTTVAAADGTYSDSQTFTWNVSPLYLATPTDQSNLDDDTVSLSLAAAYHGGGTVSYSATGLPNGLTLNSGSGLVSGTLTNTADVDGPYSVTETATDGTDSATVAFNWEVDPRVTVAGVDNQLNVTGDSVSFTVTAAEGSSDTVTWSYSASGLPTGLSINSATGVISGTLSATVGTSDTVTVSASDGTGSASTTFDWTVVPVTWTAPTNQDSVGSTTISLALQTDIASGYTATYSASGLPPGLSINSSTGVISGTLDSGDTNNTYVVTVTATADGVTASQQFSWTVGTVVVAPIADQTSTEGNTVSLMVSASTVSGTLTYSASGLPTGLTINSSTGVISGTLGAGTAVDGPWGWWELAGGITWDGPYEPGETPSRGINRFVATGTELSSSYTVTVVASNGTVSASQTFNWAVQPKAVVTAVADQRNVEGDSVSLGVTASEAGATLTYSASGLPTGLTINSGTGVISGTVAIGDSSVGTYGVDVTVSDGTYSSDVFFGWTVQHGSNHAPVLTAPGTQVNTVGDSVNLALFASDADGDTLTYSADGLPDGLDIDPNAGVIYGAVAEDALQTTPYAVTVTVDDGNGGTTMQTFNWLVNDSALSVTAASLTDSAGADSGTVTVATFTDTDPNWDPSAFTATITWGDGSSDEGEVDGSNGSYTVTDDHVYDHAGTYAMQVSVTDGYNTTNATGTATVNDSTLTLSGGVQVGAVANTGVTGTWASFTDTNRTTTSDSYTTSINWGDGSATTTGTVTGEDGQFVVSGSHTYASDETATVTVTLTDQDGTTATVNSTAQVGDLFAGEAATMTLASFTVADASEPASAYTAVVNWGDSTVTTTATVTGSAGVFTVTGTHTYTTDSLDQPNGADTVTVTLTGPNETTLNSSGNQTLAATKSVVVVRPPITGYGDELLATPSVTFTNAEVATFTEPDTNDGSGEFAATINWGDGTSSDGTVTGSNGLFHVLGSHSYAKSGSFAIVVDVSQGWDSDFIALDQESTAEVADDEVAIQSIDLFGNYKS